LIPLKYKEKEIPLPEKISKAILFYSKETITYGSFPPCIDNLLTVAVPLPPTLLR